MHTALHVLCFRRQHQPGLYSHHSAAEPCLICEQCNFTYGTEKPDYYYGYDLQLVIIIITKVEI